MGGIAPATATNNPSYVAMENRGSTVGLGSLGGGGGQFGGKMAGGPLGPLFTKKQLSPDGVSALHEMGRQALGR